MVFCRNSGAAGLPLMFVLNFIFKYIFNYFENRTRTRVQYILNLNILTISVVLTSTVRLTHFKKTTA